MEDDLLMKYALRQMLGNNSQFGYNAQSRSSEMYTNKEFVIQDQERFLVPNRYSGHNNATSECIMFSHTVTTGHRSKGPKVNVCPTNQVNIKTLIKNAGAPIQGRFFLCRCITPPHKMTSIMTVVDDPIGKRAVRLALYNYTSAVDNLENILPVGLVLAIKNPWFKQTMDGGFTVRCDNPADVVVISPEILNSSFPDLKWNGEIPTRYNGRAVWQSYITVKCEHDDEVVNFKYAGNCCFVDKQFSEAARFYTQALDIMPENIDLLANRGACFINLGCYNKAMIDIDKVLELEPFHVKGMYRKVKILWGLERYNAAIDFLNLMGNTNPDVKSMSEFRLLKKKSETFLKQNETGVLDMVHMLSSKLEKSIDVAEYKGPFKLMNIPEKGRGLIATEVIQAGQLILCNKAFAYTVLDSVSDHLLELSINLETKTMNTPGHDSIVASIVQKLAFEPELGQPLFELSAGPELGHLKTVKGEIDDELDIKRIDRIVTYNAFSIKAEESELPTKISSPKSTGLWIMPSYMNHSCSDANAYWDIFADIMVVRAVRSIQIGQEILIPYVSPYLEYQERQRVFRSHEFACDCLLCRIEQEDKVGCKIRSEILQSIQDVNSSLNLDEKVKKVFQFISLQEKIPKLNLIMGHPIIQEIALQLVQKGDWRTCVELLKKAHFVTKDTAMAKLAVHNSCGILGCYLQQKSIHVKVIKKWTKQVKHDLIVAYGSLEPMRILGASALKILKSSDFGIEFFESEVYE